MISARAGGMCFAERAALHRWRLSRRPQYTLSWSFVSSRVSRSLSMRNSRWLFDLARALAVVGALGIGSAVARAEDESESSSNQDRTSQSRDDDSSSSSSDDDSESRS